MRAGEESSREGRSPGGVAMQAVAGEGGMLINSENKPYFTAISAEYLALAPPDDKEIIYAEPQHNKL
jgi:hypothetical protein